jgi:ankyrin repeat protein
VINSSNQNPLHDASLKGNIETVEFLIKNGADINAKDHNKLTALHFACFDGHKDIVEKLIENKADVNVELSEESPLHLASLKNHHEIVKLLLEKGGDIEAKDNKGRTPLHYAMWENSTEAIDELLKSGANRNTKDMYSNLPADYLEYSNQRNFSEKKFINFLDGDLNPDIQNKYQQTPLHYAARNNSLDTLNFLLEKAVDIDAKDKFGATALYYAIKNNHLQAAVLLLENGADAGIFKDFKNISPEFNFNVNKDLQKLLRKTQRVDLYLNQTINGHHENFKLALDILKSINLKNRIDHFEKGNFLFLMIEGDGDASKKINTLNLLSSEGFDIYKTNSEGDNILSLALKKGDKKLIEEIFKEENGLDLARLFSEARGEIELIQQPASCFSCLYSGNVMTIKYKQIVIEKEIPSIKIKLEKEASEKLIMARENRRSASASLGFASAN